MLPDCENEEDEVTVLGELSAPIQVTVEAVGRCFEQLQIRYHHKHSHDHIDGEDTDQSESGSSEDELPDDEDETLLFSLDPREWRKQDHYAVLGLRKLRITATSNLIKKAYKAKVLKHHPDKRRKLGNVVKDDDYFTCISKAYEILGNPVKRRSYDSVDAEFDNEIPPNCANSKQNFFTVFGPVFERNARWSVKKPVHKLGDMSASYREVDRFYSFWYDFVTWREYSYLDEEEKEKVKPEERRWIEKQNKVARQKRKKEETARIRQLVDNAYACDPRVQKFKDEEKEKKLARRGFARKHARAKLRKKKSESLIKQEALEEERKKKEAEEEAARIAAAAAKKEKDALRKALKKEKKILRTTVKDSDYFASNDNERLNHMQEVEKLAEMLSITSLQTLNESLTSGDEERAKKAFLQQVKELKEKMEKEKMQQLEALQKQSVSETSHVNKDWSEQEMQFMVSAVNLFPAGTRDRWEVIANFILQHVESSKKTARDVLKKAKELQKNDFYLKEEAQKKAFEKFEKQHVKGSSATPSEGHISQRYESVGEQQVREQGTNPAPWTSEEQKHLEQSLKTYPADVADRWDKIAANIPSRSKKDCIKRYKELVEMVRAKKMAQTAAAKAKKT